MIAWTTPTFTLRMPAKINMELVKNLYFTISQHDVVVIDKRGEYVVTDGQLIYVYCEQEETGRLDTGIAEWQLNWTYENGRRMASRPKKINVDKNMLKEVLV